MEKKFYEATFRGRDGRPVLKNFMFYASYCEDDINYELEKYGLNVLGMGSFSYDFVEVTDTEKQISILNEFMNRNAEKIVDIRKENQDLSKLRNKLLKKV